MNLFLTKIDVTIIGQDQDVSILEKLHSIEQKLAEQNMLQKVMLNCLMERKIFFNRFEPNDRMQRNGRVEKQKVRKGVKSSRKQNGRAKR